MAKPLATSQGVIALHKVVREETYLALCGELILRLKAGKKTVLDFKEVAPDDLAALVESLAPLYEIFQSEGIAEYLDVENLTGECALLFPAMIRHVKEVTQLAHACAGVTDVVRPIVLRAFRELNTAFIKWLSNYLDYPIHFYGVDLNALDSEAVVEGEYYKGQRHVR